MCGEVWRKQLARFPKPADNSLGSARRTAQTDRDGAWMGIHTAYYVHLMLLRPTISYDRTI